MEIVYEKWDILRKRVEGWQYKDISGGSRLYYNSLDDKEKYGFDFMQINMVSYTAGEEWRDVDADCELLLHGRAYFDGIRHLYFGDESTSNLGYFYYPSIQNIKEALDRLQELVEKYCKEY